MPLSHHEYQSEGPGRGPSCLLERAENGAGRRRVRGWGVGWGGGWEWRGAGWWGVGRGGVVVVVVVGWGQRTHIQLGFCGCEDSYLHVSAVRVRFPPHMLHRLFSVRL